MKLIYTIFIFFILATNQLQAQIPKLLLENGQYVGDNISANAIAVGNNYVAVGLDYVLVGPVGVSKVVIFKRTNDINQPWVQTFEILMQEPSSYIDEFAKKIAIKEDKFLVISRANYNPDNEPFMPNDKVLMYELGNNETWNLKTTFNGTYADFSPNNWLAIFDIDKGFTYFYKFENNQWVKKSEIDLHAIQDFPWYYSWALDFDLGDDFLAVGSFAVDKVFLFKREGDIWKFDNSLLPSKIDDADINIQFGRKVSIGKDYLVTYSSGDLVEANKMVNNYVYIFKRNAQNKWIEHQILTTKENTLFYYNPVLYDDKRIALISQFDINDQFVTYFDLEGDTWVEQYKYTKQYENIGCYNLVNFLNVEISANTIAAIHKNDQERLHLYIIDTALEPPLLSGIADLTVDEDTPLINIPFTLQAPDKDLKTTSFSVIIMSMNQCFGYQNKYPNPEISVKGEGTNRFIEIKPVANSNGTYFIYLQALPFNGFNDGMAQQTIQLTIKGINDPPDFEIDIDTIIRPMNFADKVEIHVTPLPVPLNEQWQKVTYTLSPASVEFANVMINDSTGNVSIQSVPNKFGEQTFSIIATDSQKPVNASTKQLFFLQVQKGEIKGDEGDKDDKDIEELIAIYPNPFHKEATFVASGKYKGLFQIKILDIQGRVCKIISITKEGDQINQILPINDLPTGLYIAEIFGETFITRQKLIKY